MGFIKCEEERDDKGELMTMHVALATGGPLQSVRNQPTTLAF